MIRPALTHTVGPNRHFLGLSAAACGCGDAREHRGAQVRTVAELNHRISTAWNDQRPALREQRDEIIAAMEEPK
jgi:hypothetical protein